MLLSLLQLVAFVSIIPALYAAPADGACRTSPRAALLKNDFERATAGRAYPLTEWAKDGWNAPFDEGMSNRTFIDTSVAAHSGSKSLRVFYPAGQIDPQNSGALAPFAVPRAREVYLSYWVRFAPGFSWGTTQFAGKLGLGLAGGKSCSGGQACDGTNGFSSRMIWRSGGQAAIYYYTMGHAGQYGDYTILKAGGKDIYYTPGQWANIAQRLKVNTVSGGKANADGEIEIFYNGKSAALITGLRFVSNGDLVDKAYFSSFFGGATPEFAPKVDSYIHYDDIKVSTSRSDICELSGGC